MVQIFLGNPKSWKAPKPRDDAATLRAITGRIDLVHCNDSGDAAGSGRERHANLSSGQIDTEHLVAAVKAADAPVIWETAAEGRKGDIAFLRESLR